MQATLAYDIPISNLKKEAEEKLKLNPLD